MVISTEYPSDLLVTRLIHHHSVHSPFYDPAETIVKNDLEVTRAHYMKESSSFLPTEIESPLVPKDRHGFLAVLEIGEKNVTQFLYMDTGSSLFLPHTEQKTTWTRDFVLQPVPFVGGKTSSGHLAIETFKFGTQKSILKDIVFGCTAKSSLYVNGVLGLGANHVSLVSQTLSTKFSYCIGNISDRFYQHNTLIMGNKLKLHDTQTPMVIEDKYYITLESIKEGDKKLEIDSQVFMRKSDEYTGGMVIDSGTTYSFLPQIALDKLEEEIENVIDFNLARNLSIPIPGLENYEMLCYI
ncbi:hypothetical protein ACJIZ3_025764 [Penstemon smallii]|uniref:Peptidase A1 domain-containing protein n=1 Tax=Penstemon smallii TaxID=265156 RepID=A0ABD3TYW4_9LAMI